MCRSTAVLYRRRSLIILRAYIRNRDLRKVRLRFPATMVTLLPPGATKSHSLYVQSIAGLVVTQWHSLIAHLITCELVSIHGAPESHSLPSQLYPTEQRIHRSTRGKMDGSMPTVSALHPYIPSARRYVSRTATHSRMATTTFICSPHPPVWLCGTGGSALLVHGTLHMVSGCLSRTDLLIY